MMKSMYGDPCSRISVFISSDSSTVALIENKIGSRIYEWRKALSSMAS